MPDDKLAESIERVRVLILAACDCEQCMDVLAVCDAAARVGELERERDEARALNGELHREWAKESHDRLQLCERHVAELNAALATISGIERLLRAGYMLNCEGGWFAFEHDSGSYLGEKESLAAAVQAALEEMDRG